MSITDIRRPPAGGAVTTPGIGVGAAPARPGTAALTRPGTVEPRVPRLVPVHRGSRFVGAYVLDHGTARFRPVIDVRQLLVAAVGVTGIAATAATVRAATRRTPAIGAVTMGPGGWVSLKRGSAPALRPARSGRPWWARLLRARRLVVQD